MKLVLCFSLLLGGAALAVAADEKDKPEAKIRSPRAGEEMQNGFSAKGRTKNVPDDHLVILFRPVGDDGFLFPLCEAIKGNRSFSEKIYHEPGHKGDQVIQVRMVPVDIAKKITEYRRAILKWSEDGRKGPMPSLAPGLLESSKRLAEVEYRLHE